MIDALALLISTTVGAGVLALPKALSEVGILGIALIFFPAISVYFLSLLILEMLKKESKPIQLPNLIADILGGNWKYITYFSLIFTLYGALTAYLIGFGEQTAVLLRVNPNLASLFLFLVGTFIVYKGTHFVKKLDFPLSLLLVIFLVFMSALNFFNMSHKVPLFFPSFKNAFSYMAVSLFALSGVNVLPEVNYLAKGKARLVAFLSTAICLLLYLSFAITTVGVLGNKVTGLGTKGLAIYYGGWFLAIISSFTLVALFTSFLGLGLSLRHIYDFDFGIGRVKATAAAVLPPLLFFAISKLTGTGFLGVLSIAGELTYPIFGLVAVYAYIKFKKRISLKYAFISAYVAIFNALMLFAFILSYA